MVDSFLDKLAAVDRRYDELNQLMASGTGQWQALSREQAGIASVVEKYRQYKSVVKELGEAELLVQDSPEPEMRSLALQEVETLKKRRDGLVEELRTALLPRDAASEKDAIVEVRAGTGGEEAALFAGDLFRMYQRYAQNNGWKVEVLDSSQSERGGFKEIIFEVKGRSAYGRLRHERGVHRVQRVPVTEASGRIHTSTATVIVMPEVEEVDLDLRPEDLKVEFYHASSAGGQNVNKVATAVRILHIPTGIMASCQDERFQLRNRQKAMAVLRARVRDHEERKKQEELSKERRSQVGSADRAEKIRTYNFPQNRITDHRVGLTVHRLTLVLEGDLDELIDAVAADERARQLEEAVA